MSSSSALTNTFIKTTLFNLCKEVSDLVNAEQSIPAPPLDLQNEKEVLAYLTQLFGALFSPDSAVVKRIAALENHAEKEDSYKEQVTRDIKNKIIFATNNIISLHLGGEAYDDDDHRQKLYSDLKDLDTKNLLEITVTEEPSDMGDHPSFSASVSFKENITARHARVKKASLLLKLVFHRCMSMILFNRTFELRNSPHSPEREIEFCAEEARAIEDRAFAVTGMRGVHFKANAGQAWFPGLVRVAKDLYGETPVPAPGEGALMPEATLIVMDPDDLNLHMIHFLKINKIFCESGLIFRGEAGTEPSCESLDTASLRTMLVSAARTRKVPRKLCNTRLALFSSEDLAQIRHESSLVKVLSSFGRLVYAVTENSETNATLKSALDERSHGFLWQAEPLGQVFLEPLALKEPWVNTFRSLWCSKRMQKCIEVAMLAPKNILDCNKHGDTRNQIRLNTQPSAAYLSLKFGRPQESAQSSALEIVKMITFLHELEPALDDNPGILKAAVFAEAYRLCRTLYASIRRDLAQSPDEINAEAEAEAHYLSTQGLYWDTVMFFVQLMTTEQFRLAGKSYEPSLEQDLSTELDMEHFRRVKDFVSSKASESAENIRRSVTLAMEKIRNIENSSCSVTDEPFKNSDLVLYGCCGQVAHVSVAVNEIASGKSVPKCCFCRSPIEGGSIAIVINNKRERLKKASRGIPLIFQRSTLQACIVSIKHIVKSFTRRHIVCCIQGACPKLLDYMTKSLKDPNYELMTDDDVIDDFEDKIKQAQERKRGTILITNYREHYKELLSMPHVTDIFIPFAECTNEYEFFYNAALSYDRAPEQEPLRIHTKLSFDCGSNHSTPWSASNKKDFCGAPSSIETHKALDIISQIFSGTL